MAFSDFIGNQETVQRLREMLARDRFPHAVILSGPQGAGKYTLALMLARAMNCLGTSGDRVSGRPTPGDGSTGQTWAVQSDGLPDFCGVCDNCRRIGEAADLEARCA